MNNLTTTMTPEQIVAELRADPGAAEQLFPRIMTATTTQLPGEDEKKLVIVPKADAWADS
ncbi:MAG TPA: hypothetical protein VGN81_01880 [Pseudonocardiaceae bacterium]